jgi:hypothetical protein
MCYCGPMRYALQFPAHQLGGWMELCVKGIMRYQRYGLRGVRLYNITMVIFHSL